MGRSHRFAVIGCGNGGMTLAGQIAAKGYDVNLFEGLEPSEAFLKLRTERKIFLKGDIESEGLISCVTTDIKEAIDDAKTILIVVPAFAHEPLFKKIIPHLKDGHRIVLIPGNFGSLLLKKMLRDSNVTKNISISEVSSLPYACRIKSYNTVLVYKQKKILKLATCPAIENKQVLDTMNDIINIFVPAPCVLEVSLDNFNCILHPLPALLNIGAIEKSSLSFRHYIDGVTPVISKLMDKMDIERLNIGKAYFVELVPTLQQLKMYYGQNNSASIYEYVNSDQSPYKDIAGHNVYSRYITEDIPYIVVPAMLLGKRAGIDVSIFNMCIKIASQLHDKDYLKEGYNLQKLGIEDLSPDELFNYCLDLSPILDSSIVS